MEERNEDWNLKVVNIWEQLQGPDVEAFPTD